MPQYPITIETFADYLRAGYTLHVICHHCDRAEKFDIQAWVDAGHGDESTINRKWRCSRCGKPGSVRIEPTGAPGWVKGYPG